MPSFSSCALRALQVVLIMVPAALRINAAIPDTVKPVPPKQVITTDFSAIGPRTFQTLEGLSNRQSVYEGSLSFLQRQPIREGPWYWGWGVRSEVYSFYNRSRYPVDHLQDYAAQASLEYFVGAEPVASLTLYPGFYFVNDPTLSAWDVPFELVSGIPITNALSGVIGVDYARFYRYPTPIAGFSWTMNPKVRFDLVYPNPAVVVALKKNMEARLAGELIGGGFRTPLINGRTHVEYYEYRVGAHVSAEIMPGLKVIGGAGYVMDRVFNFLPNSLRDPVGGAPFIHLGLELSRY